MRKPRTDSTLDYLPEDQAEQLMEWILGRVPYRAIAERMREEYGVETSIRALSKYWQKWGSEHWKARRQDALAMARDVVEDAKASPGQFSEAALEAIEQKVFALALDPESSAREVKGLAQILMKRGDQEIRKRDQELARERLADSRERWRESLKSSIDRGLDALFDDIAGNPEAEALFERLRAAVSKGVAEAVAEEAA